MKIIEKSWNEFWAYYFRVTSRKRIPNIFEWDKKVVSLIEAKCNLTPPKRILDLGCGGGDQAKVFAERGYTVVGIDIAEPLIEYARSQFDALGLSATFIANDMRNINYRNEFDICTLLSGTFGFFTDDGNLDLLRKINAALVPDGYAFIMYLSAHRTDLTKSTWIEIEGTYRLTKS